MIWQVSYTQTEATIYTRSNSKNRMCRWKVKWSQARGTASHDIWSINNSFDSWSLCGTVIFLAMNKFLLHRQKLRNSKQATIVKTIENIWTSVSSKFHLRSELFRKSLTLSVTQTICFTFIFLECEVYSVLKHTIKIDFWIFLHVISTNSRHAKQQRKRNFFEKKNLLWHCKIEAIILSD